MLTDDLTGGSTAAVGVPGSAERRSGGGGWLRRVLVLLVAVLLCLTAVRGLLVQSFVVPSGSMEPTLRPGDRLLVTRWAGLTGHIDRGDVVVFDGAGSFEAAPAPARSALAGAGRAIAAGFGLPVGSSDYVKRVIGLPGDRVACCDADGRLTVDGVPLDERYLRSGESPSALRFDIEVPPGRLWVMGDHRSDSADSRAHLGDPGGGTVPVNRVVGRVAVVFWPPSRAGSEGMGP